MKIDLDKEVVINCGLEAGVIYGLAVAYEENKSNEEDTSCYQMPMIIEALPQLRNEEILKALYYLVRFGYLETADNYNFWVEVE